MPSLALPSPPAAVTWLLSGGGGIISGSAVVDINIQKSDGSTPLHHASERGKTEMVQLLVSNGAEVNIKEKQLGYTPLDYAKGKDAVADLLRDAGGKRGKDL